MRQYRLTIIFAIAAIVFTIIASLTVNRAVIAVLFLILLAFIGVADTTIQRSRRRELSLVETQLAERKKAGEELAQHAIALEAANKELEAFSYSVSHDLRSPLRSIDGFSLALLEDYEDQLDEEGKSYLHRVRAASQRMAQLIDDLLQLSRLTRKEMHREGVDLSAIAQTVSNELQRSQPERQVECVIDNDLVADGDGKLLQVMLENLLGNAWKFTGKQENPHVEFGADRNNGTTVYFVRDNGAGFDMQYADKLFGAFQRLHSMSEFEGTGIGLANVQRIVHRHGGSVWAEAEVGQGATFYFTLQPYLEQQNEQSKQDHPVS